MCIYNILNEHIIVYTITYLNSVEQWKQDIELTIKLRRS